jgi:large subunit ribosomal protein L31
VKPNTHPEYNEITVHCACGASWQTRTTAKDMHLDICSNCHPFFTGRQKLIDTEGRVDRFTKKFGVQTAEARKTAAKEKKAAAAKTAKKKVS